MAGRGRDQYEQGEYREKGRGGGFRGDRNRQDNWTEKNKNQRGFGYGGQRGNKNWKQHGDRSGYSDKYYHCPPRYDKDRNPSGSSLNADVAPFVPSQPHVQDRPTASQGHISYAAAAVNKSSNDEKHRMPVVATIPTVSLLDRSVQRGEANEHAVENAEYPALQQSNILDAVAVCPPNVGESASDTYEATSDGMQSITDQCVNMDTSPEPQMANVSDSYASRAQLPSSEVRCCLCSIVKFKPTIESFSEELNCDMNMLQCCKQEDLQHMCDLLQHVTQRMQKLYEYHCSAQQNRNDSHQGYSGSLESCNEEDSIMGAAGGGKKQPNPSCQFQNGEPHSKKQVVEYNAWDDEQVLKEEHDKDLEVYVPENVEHSKEAGKSIGGSKTSSVIEKRKHNTRETNKPEHEKDEQKLYSGSRPSWHKPSERGRHDRIDTKRPYSKLIEEIDGDLFTAPDDMSLAHCVATDMRMGAGIAITFRSKFGGVMELLDQKKDVGQVAVLKVNDRYIYYLVTKYLSTGKPTLETLVSSLRAMRDHCLENKVKKIAMPRIGCGLDRLKWFEVKRELFDIFDGTGVHITVYNFKEEEGDNAESAPRKDKLFLKTVTQGSTSDNLLNYDTAIIFFGSEDGTPDSAMTKFEPSFAEEYTKSRKHVGEFVEIKRGKELIFVLIVKKNASDEFSFHNLDMCLKKLKPVLKKKKYEYMGFEAIGTENDPYLTHKIVTVIKHHFRSEYMELYVCWPENLLDFVEAKMS